MLFKNLLIYLQCKKIERMDIKDKRSLKLRLRCIYIGYFVILAFGFIHSVLPTMFASLKLGIKEVYSMQEQLSEESAENIVWYILPVKPSIFEGAWSEMESSIPDCKITASTYEGFINVRGNKEMIPSKMLERIDRYVTADNFLAMALIPSQLAIYVLIALIIISLRNSVKEERPLPKRNITYMRSIGILVILIAIIDAISYSLNHSIVRMIASEKYAEVFSNQFPIEYGELVMGLLIIFAAEVFVIGTRLSEEQEYTI